MRNAVHMKKTIQSGMVLITLLMTNVVWSGTLSDNSLKQLMVLSGINKQVGEFPGMVRAGVAQARKQGAPIPEKEFAEVSKIIEGAFNPSAILKGIGREIKKNVSEADAQDLMAWYKSDLGRRITKTEEKAATPAAYEQMTKQAKSLLADKKRLKLAKQLESLLKATEMTMQLQENTGIAVFTAISSILNPGKAVNLKPYKYQLAQQKPQMRASVEQLVLLSFVFSYKDIDIPSVKKYINFNKRPATKRFNESGIKGMTSALNQSIDKMATSLAVAYKKRAKS